MQGHETSCPNKAKVNERARSIVPLHLQNFNRSDEKQKMTFNPDIHHRRSIRLKHYDYTQPGGYFVTVVSQDRECILGCIEDGGMLLNNAGRMVQSIWEGIPKHYTGIDIDAFQIMPNHVHGIIIITKKYHTQKPTITVGAGPRACPQHMQPGEDGQPRGVAPTALSLSDVVHRFKSMTTKRYINGVKLNNWPPFPGKLWQRNYYDHIIRDDKDLNHIREYIRSNPHKWEFDSENPDLIM